MQFLKDLQEFEKWKEDHSSSVVELPEEFPCFAYFMVTDWGMEEETAQYLYLDNLKDMLTQIVASL